MMIEVHYDIILKRIVTVFDELKSIISDVKSNYEIEKSQDPRLTLEIVNDAYSIVDTAEKRFELYGRRTNDHWSVGKYIEYIQQKLNSFYREFDNPFLGSQRWYQRIVQLLDRLSQESRELDRLFEIHKSWLFRSNGATVFG